MTNPHRFPERDQGRFSAGVSHSPATEFRPGSIPHNRLPVGAVTIRTFRGVRRAWVKVSEPNVWRERAKVVWESRHGPIPRGRVIHHRDRDTLNDDPSNLQALTRKEHALEHAEEVRAAGFSSDVSRERAVARRRRSHA